MTPLIQSNIQINASDVSNAIFAELQKKLVEKHTLLKEQSTEIYNRAKDLSTAYVETAKEVIEKKEKVLLDQLCLLLSARSEFPIRCKIRYGLRYETESYGADYLYEHNFRSHNKGYSFDCTPVLFSTVLYTPGKEETILDSVNLVGLTISVDDYYNNRLTCGKDAAFEDFKTQIMPLYKEYADLEDQAEKVKELINGKVDPNNGLTLKEHINASIATQAIAQIPELANMLNMDIICADIGTKLLGGAV